MPESRIQKYFWAVNKVTHPFSIYSWTISVQLVHAFPRYNGFIVAYAKATILRKRARIQPGSNFNFSVYVSVHGLRFLHLRDKSRGKNLRKHELAFTAFGEGSTTLPQETEALRGRLERIQVSSGNVSHVLIIWRCKYIHVLVHIHKVL